MDFGTKTYIATAWDEDQDAIQQLLEWSENSCLFFEFKNIHDYKQSRDTSLSCSIKKSLSERMDMCKLFVLIVGDKTTSVTKGSCTYCRYYRYSEKTTCTPTNKSFIEYECDKAKRDYERGKIKILVLYNSSSIYKYKCPESLRNIGYHCAMKEQGVYNYKKVKLAFIQA